MNSKALRRKAGSSWTVSFIMMVVVLSPLVAASPGGADVAAWSNAQPVVFPGGLSNTAPPVDLGSLSCSSSTCVAVGTFSNASGDNEAMSVTSSDGGTTWSNAQPVVFPGGVQNVVPASDFTSVSCTDSTCTAVGYFRDTIGDYEAMTQSSSDGGATWANAQPITFASGVQSATPESFVDSVSCAGSACVAAGDFLDVNGGEQAMTVTSSDGGTTWSNAQPVAFASGVENTPPQASLYSISCSGSSCVAVGSFLDASARYEAMTETSSDGGVTWSNAQPATFASGVQNATTEAFFESVSCSGPTCVAAGYFFNTSGEYEAMTDSSSDGGVTWANAQPIALASGVQTAPPENYFFSVSCSSLHCVAAGFFYDVNGNSTAMTQTSSDGGATWAQAQPISYSSGEQYSTPYSDFTTVSCFASTCVAAGEFRDVNGNYQAATESSSDGGTTWTNAQLVAFASGVQNTSPQSDFDTVSCSSTDCVSAGTFLDANGNWQGMTDAKNAAPAATSPTAVTDLSVSESGPRVSASWTTSAGATSYTCTLLYAFNTPSAFTVTTTTTSCSFGGLNAKAPYGVAVVANGLGGNSTSVSAFGTPSPVTTTTVPKPKPKTIICVRGKRIKRVRGLHPTCPAGYKKR